MKLHYFQSPNFGDALSPLLVAKLSGEKVEWADAYDADVVGVGSVLYTGHWLYRESVYGRTPKGFLSYLREKVKVRRAPIKIWGSGFLEEPKDAAPVLRLRKAEVKAVRGKETLRILKKLGFVKEETGIAFGDPGILYSTLLETMPKKEHTLGLIPHYMDKDAGARLAVELKAKGVKVNLIDVMNPDPIETVRQIAMCETILSSSLHGCIVSDGMGIPNHQVSFSTLGFDKKTYLLKYRDYYSALDMELPEVWCAADCGVADLSEKIKVAYRVAPAKVEEVKSGLVKVFPRLWEK